MCTESNEQPKLVKLKVKLENWVCIVGNVEKPPVMSPECWKPNNSAYPLCKGEPDSPKCKECCLWEDYGPPESYYER